MLALEKYKTDADRYYEARNDVALKYRRDEPIVGPLTEQASVYEAMSLIHEGTRVDHERLLAAYSMDLIAAQEDLGRA